MGGKLGFVFQKGKPTSTKGRIRGVSSKGRSSQEKGCRSPTPESQLCPSLRLPNLRCNREALATQRGKVERQSQGGPRSTQKEASDSNRAMTLL